MKQTDSNFAVALKGLTIIAIEGCEVGSDEIRFKTKCGRQFRMYHSQDCCESVNIVRCGSPYLSEEGVEVTDAREVIENNVPASESATRTTFVFNDNSYQKFYAEWLGESNGYYSESVSFVEEFPDAAETKA